MKKLDNFLAIIALILLFGYISFKEIKQRKSTRLDTISDEYTMEPEYALESSYVTAVTFDLPEDVKFAGESVPLNLPDVKERLDKEIQINTYLHSNTIFLIKRAARWLPQMKKILKANGIPEDFQYLPLIESNLLNVVSPKEAAGYWQILPTSGKEFGLEVNDQVDERYDPLKATEAACKYLRQSYGKFNNWTLVAASYNRGMAGIARAIDQQKVDNYYDLYLNDETSRYVFRILAIKEIISNPEKYGFKVNKEHLYEMEEVKYLEVKESIRDLVVFAKDNGTNYKLLKRHNPWLRDDKLNVKKGKVYQIAIPDSN
jgi:membrane-bound lytic murein transglycosylase D